MTERDSIWDALKAHSKSKFDADRKNFKRIAEIQDDGLWNKHTDYHWSRYVNGKRLDYWPSRNKFMFEAKVMRGNVYDFIKRQTP